MRHRNFDFFFLRFCWCAVGEHRMNGNLLSYVFFLAEGFLIDSEINAVQRHKNNRKILIFRDAFVAK
jgi:hypothetical protein